MIKTVEPLRSSYYYDWTQNPPFTDHPGHRGKIHCGTHNPPVLCDGVAYYEATRFVTGENGWIEFRNRSPVRGNVTWVWEPPLNESDME